MAEIRVAISGAGKMGREVARALRDDPELVACGFIDPLAGTSEIDGLPVRAEAVEGLDAFGPGVVVDFSNAAFTPGLVEAAIVRGIRPVVGTTGLHAEWLQWLAVECERTRLGAVVASNFAIGAVLMMEFARQASKHFDAAEIIELHHDQKVDAPSGTAKSTAEGMLAARGRPFEHAGTERETVPGTRGGELGGIAIHSVRLAGFVAHQEVIFGAPGQTLTLRHDTTGRESFMPGVLLAVKAVGGLEGLVVGLEGLLGLRAGR
ncbi:MAG: 4-hydroxy-tetrahydrodipicolinate reductase [Dehalococcoidia bacterium]